jgi:hypothetical protein
MAHEVGAAQLLAEPESTRRRAADQPAARSAGRFAEHEVAATKRSPTMRGRPESNARAAVGPALQCEA